MLFRSEKVYHQVKGIDYLPLQEQQLALVLAKRPDTSRTNRIISTYLTNKVFEQEFSGTVGYSLAQMGDCIYES